MNINYNPHEITDWNTCWLIPITTTLGIFYSVCSVFKHGFNHEKLNSIYEVMWGRSMIPEALFFYCGFSLLLLCDLNSVACWQPSISSLTEHVLVVFDRPCGFRLWNPSSLPHVCLSTHPRTHPYLLPSVPNWELFLQELLTFVGFCS